MTDTMDFAPPRGDVAKRFLEPSSVAIVGVSTSTGQAYKAGGRAVLDHLGVYGYAGEVTVIHPSATSVDGRPAVPSLRDLATVPDVVVIAVPAAAVLGVLQECAAVGARQALILTAGFADMGAAGHELEQSILRYAKDVGINVVGPNSTGLVNVRTGLAMSMTSVLTEGEPIAAGGIAVIAQSGAIGSTVVERARDAGVGISHIVSTGNQRDMDIPDFIGYFAGLPEVDTVALYMESIRDGRRFAEAVRQLDAAGKRLITYLGGRSAAGEQAAASHTGKIIGRGALELALLRALGVTVVDDPDDLWVLGAMKAPGRDFPRQWGMVAYSGGMAVLATEQLAAAGVMFPPLTAPTVERLKAQLPSFATIPNPLDVGPGSMPVNFGGYLAAVAEDPAVEAVCVPLPMGARGWNSQSVADILAVGRDTGKPCVVLWYGGRAVDEYVRQLRDAGVLVAQSPSDLGRLVRALLGPERVPDTTAAAAAAGSATRAATIGGARALRLLADHGLDVAPMTVCDSAAAPGAAEALGYPVVVKSADEDISHRTEFGLVAVNLSDRAQVEDAVEQMAAKRGAAAPTWLVQTMVRGGVELILTVRNAGDLGVFGTVGVGGAAVEVHRDVEHVPLPCDAATLHRALCRLRLAELIFGFRGSEPLDAVWIGNTLNRMAVLLRERNLAEIEVNPAIVDENGGTVVDALCVRAADQPL